MIDVSVIVVSYNTRDLTCRCVESILRHAAPCAVEVIVVDNASHDGSAEAIRAVSPDVVVIANDDNRGFAGANNQGMAVARGRYLLLLNPDTEVFESTIPEAVRFADETPNVGVVGCRSIGHDGVQQSTIFRQLRLRHIALNVVVPYSLQRSWRWCGGLRYPELDWDSVQNVDVVAGCFMLVPRDVYESVGGMDDSFFIYGEESEWCFRIRRAGGQVIYFPGASYLHYGGISTDLLREEMNISMAHGQLLLLQRTRGRLSAYAANVLMCVRDLPRWLVWLVLAAVGRTRGSNADDRLRTSARRFSFHLRGLLRTDWSTYRTVRDRVGAA